MVISIKKHVSKAILFRKSSVWMYGELKGEDKKDEQTTLEFVENLKYKSVHLLLFLTE